MEKRNALISVYEKEKPDITDFARGLVALGWTIYSSTGTAEYLTKKGVPVVDVSTLVGGGPILGHKVVTISRELGAALLADETEIPDLEELELPWIDLVCVDLYPLKKAVADPNSTPDFVRGRTDVGGPNMLAEGAKGQRIVVSDPADREAVLEWLRNGCPDREAFIQERGADAYFFITDHRLTSAIYEGNGRYQGFLGRRVATCAYGENPWQTPAALYSTGSSDPLALDKFRLVEGADPSYNNWCDLERALQTITHIAAVWEVNFGEIPFIAVGVKHGNACGAAVGFDEREVLVKMALGHRIAIHGGVVVTNFAITQQLAELLLTHEMPKGVRRLLDAVIAPEVTAHAIRSLRRKEDKCRFLENSSLLNLGLESLDTEIRFRKVRGGFLTQPNYTYVLDFNDPEMRKYSELLEVERTDLALAWAIGSTSNSNTTTLTITAGVTYLIGNGVGQQDRVGSCALAVQRAKEAGHETEGCSAYTDSFFPFPDGLEVLNNAGVNAVLGTWGSLNDAKVLDYAKSVGLTLWQIEDKRGRDFFGH